MVAQHLAFPNTVAVASYQQQTAATSLAATAAAVVSALHMRRWQRAAALNGATLTSSQRQTQSVLAVGQVGQIGFGAVHDHREAASIGMTGSVKGVSVLAIQPTVLHALSHYRT